MALTKVAAPVKRRRRPLSRLFFFVFVALALQGIPEVFRGTLWVFLHEEVLRQGGRLRVTVEKGSLWEPVVLSGVQLSYASPDGGKFKFEAKSCTIEGTFRPLLSGVWNWRFLDRVQLRGGVVDWELGGAPNGGAGESELWLWDGLRVGRVLRLPLPVTLDLELQDVRIRSAVWSIHADSLACLVSEVAPGSLKMAKLDVTVGGWTRSFREVSGKTALQGQSLKVGQVALMDGLRIESLSASPSRSEGGGLFDLESELQAFGGDIRLVAQIGAPSSEVPLEASGTFAKLGVAPLAAFLNFTEAAGGALVAGKFSFRGQPTAPDRATASLRMEARNFQWESRQWDELVVGATLLDRRIQVPEFSLKQGPNQLQLNGDIQWPGREAPWWKSDFGVNLTARVENLTELSALLLPEFKYVAGGLTVDGAVRSQGGVLGGALIVSGAHMTWRNAPVEELHAAVKLQGTEVQVLNIELAQGSDWVRGKGSVQVGQTWAYQGELHGNVRDLGKYAALLQPPVDLDPYAGGVELDWFGQGGSGGNEGRVSARFSQLRPFLPHPAWRNPVSGELAGSYNNEGFHFESLVLGDGEIRLQTGLKVDTQRVQILNLSVQRGDQITLEGNALLPREWVDQWPKLSLPSLLKSAAPFECDLEARQLDLALLARLPGTPDGLEGVVDGRCRVKGTMSDLSGSGNVSLRNGAVAVDDGLLHSAAADFSWDSRLLRVRNLAWASASGKYTGTAALEWKPGTPAPVLEASIACPEAVWRGPEALRFPLRPDEENRPPDSALVSVLGQVSWKVSGLLSDPLLSADVVVRSLDFQGVPDLRRLFADSDLGKMAWARSRNPVLKNWKLQTRVTSTDGAALLGTPGAARVDLHAGGTAGQPLWHGEIRLALRAAAAGVLLEVEPLVLRFLPATEIPEIEARVRGHFGAMTFSASALGPLGHPVRRYESNPPSQAGKVRAVFEESKAW
jgi:hypothetical protein